MNLLTFETIEKFMNLLLPKQSIYECFVEIVGVFQVRLCKGFGQSMNIECLSNSEERSVENRSWKKLIEN